MKYFAIAILTCLFLNAKSQYLTVYDFEILNQMNNIELINHYLAANKNFKYLGDFGKNAEGCQVYKFASGQNGLDVELGSGMSEDGKLVQITQLTYNVYDESTINFFYASLEKYKFKKKDEGKTADGGYYTLWFGTLNLNDMLTGISIIKKLDRYVITIV